MYTTIRHYQDEANDLMKQIQPHVERLRELMHGIDGFVAYYLIDTGGGNAVTVSVFNDRAGAEESTRVAAEWVREAGLVDAVPHPPTIMQGEVALHA